MSHTTAMRAAGHRLRLPERKYTERTSGQRTIAQQQSCLDGRLLDGRVSVQSLCAPSKQICAHVCQGVQVHGYKLFT